MLEIDPDVMMIILDKLPPGMADDIPEKHRDTVIKSLNELQKKSETHTEFADKVAKKEGAAGGRGGRGM